MLPQFRLRTLFWLTLAVGIAMMAVRAAILIYGDLRYIHTVNARTLHSEGKLAPGDPGYRRQE